MNRVRDGSRCPPWRSPPHHMRVMLDYRSVIAHALAERPFDEESVHDCVCTYVRAERDIGRSASDVIVALSELVERPGAASAAVRHTLPRRVIPWCVEAYFGIPSAGAPERSYQRAQIGESSYRGRRRTVCRAPSSTSLIVSPSTGRPSISILASAPRRVPGATTRIS